jgi:predicted enzyme related to lactoylglutathione lyase
MTEATVDSNGTGTIAWFELPAKDTERARKFYAQLFGWEFEAFGDQDYHATYEGGGAISGLEGDSEGVLVYFGVADVDIAVARVRELGGTAHDGESVPGVGRYARCADSEGNRFGLFSREGA